MYKGPVNPYHWRRLLTMDLDRRTVLQLVIGLMSSAALGQGAVLDQVDVSTLSSLLGLEPGQEKWLSDLTPPEQAELRRALREGGQRPVAPRTVQLLARVLGRRSRLYDFLGYPEVQDRRSVCDGLMRE